MDGNRDLDLKMGEMRSLLEDGDSNPPEYVTTTLTAAEWSAIRDVYINSMKSSDVYSIRFSNVSEEGCEMVFVDEVSLLPCNGEVIASSIDSIHNRSRDGLIHEDVPVKLPDWLEERLSMKDEWEDR